MEKAKINSKDGAFHKERDVYKKNLDQALFEYFLQQRFCRLSVFKTSIVTKALSWEPSFKESNAKKIVILKVPVLTALKRKLLNG